jgi:hypothetical protein
LNQNDQANHDGRNATAHDDSRRDIRAMIKCDSGRNMIRTHEQGY